MTIPKIEIHDPEELLDTAKNLIKKGYYRSSILESFSALEVYIQKIIFPILELKTSPEFSKYLKDKTKYRFLDRLEYLVPYVLSIKIDKESDIWRNFIISRQNRNLITHGGKTATKEDSKNAYESIFEILKILKIGEFKVELKNLRDSLEIIYDSIKSESELIKIIGETLSNLNLNPQLEKHIDERIGFDFFISGSYNCNFAIETKLITQTKHDIHSQIIANINEVDNKSIKLKEKGVQIDLVVLIIVNISGKNPAFYHGYVEYSDKKLMVLVANRF